jgi:hypothetical protein
MNRSLKPWLIALIAACLLVLALLLANAGPSQGDGAKQLIAKTAAVLPEPLITSMVVVPGPDVYWFGFQHGITNCSAAFLIWTNFNNNYSVGLSWDVGTCTNWWGTDWTNAYSYVLLWNKLGDSVTNSFDCGTNTSHIVMLSEPPKTNLVIVLTCANTNLTSVTFTNPFYTMFRAMANRSSGQWVLNYQARNSLPTPWVTLALPTATIATKPLSSSLKVSITSIWQ